MQEKEDLVLPVRETAKLAQQTVMPVLLAISLCHLLNDTIQSLISAIYPIVKQSYHLSFTQIGLITFTFQCTASLLQPCVGFYTDRNPKPYSLVVGMIITFGGVILLAFANGFYFLLASVGLLGIGSAIFHPESSRLARLASGGRHGFAQSLFQVGGNAGSSFGPLLAALIITRQGQSSILWFTLLALLATAILFKLCGWYKNHLSELKNKRSVHGHHHAFPRRTVIISLAILVILVFSKFVYLVSLSSYYTFYLIDKFHVSVAASQIYLFVFLFAVAAGTFMGGPLGDHFGRKYIIWASILGVAPFTLLLPHVNLFWTAVLSVIIGMILASAFSVIVVYAQELAPGNVGMVSGLFFGLAFGAAGIGSAALGKLADWTSINCVFQVCAFLPLIGFLTAFLPHIEGSRGRAKKA
jgi:FSR family fosmidomycin resistance protein-like MFS transporter